MGDSIEKLYASVLAARDRDPALSRTSKLFREGVQKMAKKLAEEAIEVGLEAVQMRPDAVILESVDLLYHLCVVWAESNVTPEDVANEIARRERIFGIAEKLPKNQAKHPHPRRIAVLEPHPLKLRKRQ
jgi:phosphoribosyl-ATP pyrophosphohydrolase